MQTCAAKSSDELSFPPSGSTPTVMTRISLIHVGDIHFPDNKSLQAIDLKDKGLTKTFTNSIAPFPLKRAMEALIMLLDSVSDIRGLLFSGDLTSRSDIDGYLECVEYLASNLSGLPIWSEDQLHVVHGNHDIVRDADTSVDALARYRPTQDAWVNRSLPVITPDGVRSVEIREGKASAWVHSLNSCIGCGEQRRIPEKVRAELGAILTKLGVAPISSSNFDLVGEQLDTPAFDIDHLSDLTARVADDLASVHLLLGHHPILPQAMPRVEIYTEAINGGLVRSALTDLRTSVLYCHGHVHDDPIEIIRDAESGTEVVFVSAPLFVHGFNLITFHFATDRRSTANAALPLGCEITRYRIRRNGGLKPGEPIRVALCRHENFEFVGDDVHHSILQALTSQPTRFRPLLESVRKSHAGLPKARFEEHLEHLDWHRMIEIVGRNAEADHWQIRRVGG
jgi:hypothetical protein